MSSHCPQFLHLISKLFFISRRSPSPSSYSASSSHHLQSHAGAKLGRGWRRWHEMRRVAFERAQRQCMDFAMTRDAGVVMRQADVDVAARAAGG